MASQRNSTNISIHSLTNAMHVDVNPPECCWYRLCGMMVMRMSGTTEMYEKTLELDNWRNIFKRLQLCNALDPVAYLVRLDGSHDRISSCDAIDLDMMHTVCVAA